MPAPVVVVLVALVVIALGAGGAWLSRRRALRHRVGSFRCSMIRGSRWWAGVAQYGSTQLYWWRYWSLRPRPSVRWERAGLTVVERSAVDGEESSGLLVVTCRMRENGRDVEHLLVMTPEAYAGLTSWIEATPSRVGTVI